MQKLNENVAKAILIANLKGEKKKRSSLTEIAQAVRFLLEKSGYESYKEIAKEFQVSIPIISSFDKINDQPQEIVDLIDQNKIGLDASTKLLTIKNIEKRKKMAEIVSGLTAFEVRQIIDYAKKHPNLSYKKCKEVVLKSAPIERHIHVLVIPFDEKTFLEFENKCKKNNTKLEDAAIQAIKTWIQKKHV